MNGHWGYMSYNKHLGCWLFDQNGYGKMMNCDEPFELCFGGDQSVTCCLGLERQWYVMMGPEQVKFNLRTKCIYWIKMI